MLTLPIKKKWFDMILSGEKKEEYRELTSYYFSRFNKYLGLYRSGDETEWKKRQFQVRFRNGYRENSPTFIATCKVDIGIGKTEWGADPKQEYYVLTIEEIKPEENK